MNKKFPKKEQTYEWALEQMSHFHNIIRLRDISKKLWTHELILEAIRHGNASLKEVPKDMVDREVCETALLAYATVIGDVPEEYKDLSLLMYAVSHQPPAFDAAFYELRKGRAGEPFSVDDIMLAMEAVSPQAYGDILVERLIKPPTFASDDERRKWIAVNAPCGRSLPKTLVYEALQALLEKRQAEAAHS